MNYVNAKVVVVGNSSVGKTSVLKRETDDSFEDSTTSTLGASFASKVIEIDEKEVHLQIWDTAGQERYRSMAPMYYRESRAAIIMFSVIDKESFIQVEFWFRSIKESQVSAILYLVGNKIDLVDEREVSSVEAESLAENYGAAYFEVSAKTSIGVHDLFVSVAKDITQKMVYIMDESNTTMIDTDTPHHNVCC